MRNAVRTDMLDAMKHLRFIGHRRAGIRCEGEPPARAPHEVEVPGGLRAEIVPEVELPSWDEIEVERSETAPSEEQTAQAMAQLGQSHQRFGRGLYQRVRREAVCRL